MRIIPRLNAVFLSLALAALVSAIAGGAIAWAHPASYISQFDTVTTLTPTIPDNGDVNPYGVAVVPRSVGNLVQGDILISNFNNSVNHQGTGTTIIESSPQGSRTPFAEINPLTLPGYCPGGVGLTTALTVLKRGWVIVGSLPTSDGTPATMKAGCLLVLNSYGQVVETFSGSGINGPWDMTAQDNGSSVNLFVTNVLNGTVAASPNVVNRGTVLRITLSVPWNYEKDLPKKVSVTTIGSGFPERTDPNALVIGPTGVGLASNGTLYVADSLNNRIAAILDATKRYSTAYTGKTLTSGYHINDPLGLTIAPNGDVLTTNGGNGNMVEITPGGTQVAVKLLDNTQPVPAGGAGALFGLATVPGGKGVYFVDDADNTFRILH